MTKNLITNLAKLSILWIIALLFCQGCDENNSITEATWGVVKRKSLDIPEPSGIAYDYRTNTLLIVSDQTGMVYRTSTDGELINTLSYEGDDPEGICVHPQAYSYYVIEEQNKDIVQIDTTGAIISTIHVSNFVSETDKGFEGIAYLEDENRFILVHEADPVSLVKVDTTGAVIKREPVFYAEDLSGITVDNTQGDYLILSDQSEKLYSVLENSEVLGEWKLDINQAEGVTLYQDTLYIVSDRESELYIFVRLLPE